MRLRSAFIQIRIILLFFLRQVWKNASEIVCIRSGEDRLYPCNADKSGSAEPGLVGDGLDADIIIAPFKNEFYKLFLNTLVLMIRESTFRGISFFLQWYR